MKPRDSSKVKNAFVKPVYYVKKYTIFLSASSTESCTCHIAVLISTNMYFNESCTFLEDILSHKYQTALSGASVGSTSEIHSPRMSVLLMTN
jgi:uncharacterized protein YqkB